MRGINPENLKTQIDMSYVQASKFALLAMLANLWPSGHINGHLTDCKYKNKQKYVMWDINLENIQALIDLVYMFRTGFCEP